MTARSRRGSEAHFPRRSAPIQEPPTEASPPPSDEGVSDHRSLDEWGNSMKKKQSTNLRILFQNVGGFSKDDDMGLKLEALRRTMTERQIDIFGFTESNTCWDVVPELQRLARRTRGWWENSQWSLLYNRRETETPIYQPGGMGILCVNAVAHQTLKPGDDMTGLGWWCWTRIRGPNGFFLRIILMYCPCYSQGPMTTYQQHVRHLTNSNRFECPRDAILSDITKEIRTWQEEGDHIIVLTDFNKAVTEATPNGGQPTWDLWKPSHGYIPNILPQPFNVAVDP